VAVRWKTKDVRKKSDVFSALERFDNGEPEEKEYVAGSGAPINHKRKVVDGHSFHSTGESERYLHLVYLKKIGQIKDFEIQPTYRIVVNKKHICRCTLDFKVILNDDRVIIEDYKPDIKDDDFRRKYLALTEIKVKLLEALHGFRVCYVTKAHAFPDESYAFGGSGEQQKLF